MEARLQLPVGRVHHLLNKRNYAQVAQHVGASAPGM
jgi:hypothetical protein